MYLRYCFVISYQFYNLIPRQLNYTKILLFVFYMINRQEKYAATTVSCWTPTLQYFEE